MPRSNKNGSNEQNRSKDAEENNENTLEDLEKVVDLILGEGSQLSTSTLGSCDNKHNSILFLSKYFHVTESKGQATKRM